LSTENNSLQILTKDSSAWERTGEESDKAYAAFCTYRDLSVSERSIELASKKNKVKNANHYARWSMKHNWVSRCRAFDAYLDIQARQKRERDHLANIEEFSERQRLIAAETLKSAVAILKKANSRLAKLKAEEIHPGSLPSYYRSAAALIEAATNSESMSLGIQELLEALQQFKSK
jgi:hypothetical protein